MKFNKETNKNVSITLPHYQALQQKFTPFILATKTKLNYSDILRISVSLECNNTFYLSFIEIPIIFINDLYLLMNKIIKVAVVLLMNLEIFALVWGLIQEWIEQPCVVKLSAAMNNVNLKSYVKIDFLGSLTPRRQKT